MKIFSFISILSFLFLFLRLALSNELLGIQMDGHGKIHVTKDHSHVNPDKHVHSGMLGTHIHDRPDEYAPMGVMGDHAHLAGTWMFSYRFMRMGMDENLDGTSRVGDSDVLRDFMVTPTSMTMDMHMFGVMYSPSDTFSLMAMFSYLDLEMDHKTRMGKRFSTRSEGLGDIVISSLYNFFTYGQHSFFLNAGVSLPAGSIDKEDDTPAGPDQKLPYPMQLGSGTFDLLPGITYTAYTDNWSWGVQILANVRIGENKNNYTLGNRLGMNSWIARKFSNAFSGSLRLAAQTWGNVRGADPDLNPRIVPTADPDRRGGTRLDMLFGVNFRVPKGFFKNHFMGIEVGTPVYQDLDGPQLGTEWLAIAGWQYAL